jgi:hypothetical protein
MISSVTGGSNVTLTGTSTAPVVNVPGPLTINTIVQPIIQYSETVGNGMSGSVTVTLPVSYSSAFSYVIFVCPRDPQVAGTALTTAKISANQFSINYNYATTGGHTIAWCTMGS